MKAFVAILLCLGLVSGSPMEFLNEDMDPVAKMDLNEQNSIPQEGYPMSLDNDDVPPPLPPSDLDQLPPIAALNEGDHATHEHCGSLMEAGYRINGTYIIKVNGTKVMLPCEFSPDFAFSIFLMRVDNLVSWNQHLATYIRGFGRPLHDFWAGLENLHLLTYYKHDGLLVRFQDWYGNQLTSKYPSFKVGPSPYYRLSLAGKCYGNVRCDLNLNNGQRFTTAWNDNSHKCGKNKHTGWWFADEPYCTGALPTGVYYPGHMWYKSDGIYWYNYHKFNTMKKMVMAIAHARR